MGVFLDKLTVAQSLDMKAIIAIHRRWSAETFGDVGPIGPLKHLSKEALEAAEAPDDPTEYADTLFLIWDALARQNHFTADELLSAMEQKMLTNKARFWPLPKDGEPREHLG